MRLGEMMKVGRRQWALGSILARLEICIIPTIEGTNRKVNTAKTEIMVMVRVRVANASRAGGGRCSCHRAVICTE